MTTRTLPMPREVAILACSLALPLAAQAGNLDNPNPPAHGSGIPTVSGLYQRLSTGAPVSPSGAFQEPTEAPAAGTGTSLADLLRVLPAADNVNGAQSAHVPAGKTFWGLSNGPTGQWGLHTGTMPLGHNVTGNNGALSMPLPDGYYDGSQTATVADTNLVPGNIRRGVTLFGVTGTSTPATGSATPDQVLSGATFSNSTGNNLTGTMPTGANVAGSNGAPSFTLPRGYYDGSQTATAADTNLVAGNIKSGVTLFGVTGSSTPATGSATPDQVLSGATFSNSTGSNLTGTMPVGANVTGSNGARVFTIPAGFYDGNKTATATDTNLAAGNIQSGTTIFGVAGTALPATGTATTAQVLSGTTFSNSSGSNLTGTLANQGAPTLTPGPSNQNLAPGYYSGGTVQGDGNLVAGNILGGTTIFGVTGSAILATGSATADQVVSGATFSNGSNSHLTGTMPLGNPVTGANGALSVTLPAGYYNGTSATVSVTDSNLVANNIKLGTTIFGVTGAALALAPNFQPTYSSNICQPGWTGSDCTSTCSNGLTGQNCDILTEPYTGHTFPDYNSTPWKCVVDTTTGLTWEVKASYGFRGKSETFTWFQEDSTMNGGNAGTANGGTCATHGHCDTEHYVADVNAAALCGFTDWRLPSKDELINYYNVNYANNSDYFPNGLNGSWSSNSWVTDNTAAYGVNASGSAGVFVKNYKHLILLVRGGM